MKKLILSIAGLAMLLSGCNDPNAVAETENIVVYKKALKNEWNLPFEKDSRTVVRPKSDKEKIDVLFDIMKQQSKDDRTVPLLPDTVKLLGASIEGKVMTVNLSKDVTAINEEQTKKLLFESIKRTMTINFSKVEDVEFQIEGVKIEMEPFSG